LDSTGRECVEAIETGAVRGRELIDGLRSMSSIGRGEPVRREVTLESLVREVARAVEHEVEAAGGEIVVGPLPVVRGDATELRQLVQNLLANALKFRSDAPPRVVVSAQRRPGVWLISVADNGVGVPPGEAERVFEVFARAAGEEVE